MITTIQDIYKGTYDHLPSLAYSRFMTALAVLLLSSGCLLRQGRRVLGPRKSSCSHSQASTSDNTMFGKAKTNQELNVMPALPSYNLQKEYINP